MRRQGRSFVGFIGWLGLFTLLIARGEVCAEVRLASGGSPVGPVVPLGLAECLGMALTSRPSLEASRANLRIARIKLEGLEGLGPGVSLLSRRLPLRIRQGRLGVRVAEADLRQTESDIAYDVKRLYFSLQYARDLEKLLLRVIEENRGYRKIVETVLKLGREDRGWTATSVELIRLYESALEARLGEARRGVARAEAALKEAMGLSPQAPLTFREEPLSVPPATATRKEIVALALARNGSVLQAEGLAGVVRLEVEAQSVVHRPGSISTFAAYTDVHSEVVPGPDRGENYRPAALPPAMPTALAGTRSTRVQWAKELAVRADAVAVETRNLVALEATNAYLNWVEARDRVELRRQAREISAKLVKTLAESLPGPGKVVIENLLTNSVLAVRAEVQLLDAYLDHLIALAELERVTASGFCACPDRASPAYGWMGEETGGDQPVR